MPYKSFFYRLLPFIVLYGVYLAGHFMDIMEIDAAQYANISKEMTQTGSYLQVREQGGDYLDKPPLLFWVSSVSFHLFGFTNFAYRLLPVLLSFLGAYSTYRLAKLYYSPQVAYYSALLLASCQALFLMNHDIRTDNMLTTFVAFSLWQLAEYFRHGLWKNLIGGFVGIGLAMLAKGPIGLIIPVLTFSMDFVLKRQWTNFFRWQYIVGLAVLALVLTPMCIGLYEQFDSQPEKLVKGEAAVSGIRFFFWTQSFGRITGENVWNNSPDPFFLVHTTLWSFLPWSVFLVIAYFLETKRIIKNGFKKLDNQQEIFVWAGYTLTFLALSQSKYQLNHYIYPIYSLGAILTAKWIEKLIDKRVWQTWFKGIAAFHMVAFVLLSSLLAFWVFPIQNYWIVSIVALFFAGAFYVWFKFQEISYKILGSLFLSITATNILLNTWVYPTLLTYQAESVVAKQIRQNPEKYQIKDFVVVGDNIMHSAINFYSTQIISHYSQLSDVPKNNLLVLCSQRILDEEIKTTPVYYKVLSQETFSDYPVTELSPEFLSPNSRQKSLKKVYLVQLKRN